MRVCSKYTKILFQFFFFLISFIKFPPIFFCRWVKPTKNTWSSLVLVFYTDVTLGQFFTVLFLCLFFFWTNSLSMPSKWWCGHFFFFFNTFWKDVQHFHYYILIEKSLIFLLCIYLFYLFKERTRQCLHIAARDLSLFFVLNSLYFM